MIFLLDVILLLNLWIAIRFFKNAMAPPILMGMGMLAASLMATSYYKEWEMDEMLPISTLILGGGTVFFTICCICLSPLIPSINLNNVRACDCCIHVKRTNIFLGCSIVIGIIGAVWKFYYLKQTFGSLGMSELIMEQRMDAREHTDSFLLPFYVRQMESYTSIVSHFTLWLLALINIYKPQRLIRGGVRKYLYLHVAVIFANALLNGSKGPIMNMIVLYGLFYSYCYYSFHKNYQVSKKIQLWIVFIILLLALSFRGLGLLIGRELEDRANIDILAEYCGAEIKNFDIYMHHPTASKKYGEETFYAFYQEIDPKYNKMPGDFQFVGNNILGNVYTQYRSFYEDFQIHGVLVMCFLIALFSIFIYGKSQKALLEPFVPNLYLFIYGTMVLALFMAFFSSKFTEIVFRLGWLRSVIYLTMFVGFLKHFIFVKSNKSPIFRE